MELADFIRARLDEVEQAAREALIAGLGSWSLARDFAGNVHLRVGQGGPAIVNLGPEELPPASKYGPHIARHDPSRVLREIDAKRQILRQHAPQQGDDGPECSTCVYTGTDPDSGGNRFRYRMHAEWPCLTVILLAMPHNDHPDYPEDARP